MFKNATATFSKEQIKSAVNRVPEMSKLPDIVDDLHTESTKAYDLQSRIKNLGI